MGLGDLKKKLFSKIEQSKKVLYTFHKRPLFSRQVNTWSDPVNNLPRFAIVIQGPVAKDCDFTLETVRLYKKHFVGANIIVSTWDDEPVNYADKIKEQGAEVILNAKPKFPGTSHINFQIASSLAGVKKAQSLGAQYVLKTRTDQRMYAPNVLEYFYNLLEKFPPAPGFKQKRRILGVSLNTFKYRLYDLSDMNIFGHVDDMLVYWGPGFDDRKFSKIPEKLGDWSKARLCEVYLSTKFLEAAGRNLTWTLKDSWQAFAENLCVVDAGSLDLYWYKYERNKEYRHLDYGAVTNEKELGFSDWFNLYSNLSNRLRVPEEALDEAFTAQVNK
jgi:hypothetical protein